MADYRKYPASAQGPCRFQDMNRRCGVRGTYGVMVKARAPGGGLQYNCTNSQPIISGGESLANRKA